MLGSNDVTDARKPEAGYVLLTTGVGLVALIGMPGIEIDVGRMYLAHNESNVQWPQVQRNAGAVFPKWKHRLQQQSRRHPIPSMPCDRNGTAQQCAVALDAR
jgi:hypothetical protein